MIIAWLPVLFAVVGWIIYFVSTKNPKVTETGRLVFFAGILALCFALARHTIKLL